MAGLVVVGFYFVGDLARLAPFSTPLALSRTFLGAGGIQTTEQPFNGALGFAVLATDLIAFTILHILVFTLLGLAAVALFRSADWPLNPFTGALYGLFAYTGVFYMSLVLIGSTLNTVWIPAFVSVLVANTLAGAMTGLVVRLLERRRLPSPAGEPIVREPLRRPPPETHP